MTREQKRAKSMLNRAARWLSLDAKVLADSFRVRVPGDPAYGRIDTSTREGAGVQHEVDDRREIARELRRMAKAVA